MQGSITAFHRRNRHVSSPAQQYLRNARETFLGGEHERGGAVEIALVDVDRTPGEKGYRAVGGTREGGSGAHSVGPEATTAGPESSKAFRLCGEGRGIAGVGAGAARKEARSMCNCWVLLSCRCPQLWGPVTQNGVPASCGVTIESRNPVEFGQVCASTLTVCLAQNMGNLVSRKKKRERDHVTDQDRAVLDLKNSRDRLKRYQKKAS